METSCDSPTSLDSHTYVDVTGARASGSASAAATTSSEHGRIHDVRGLYTLIQFCRWFSLHALFVCHARGSPFWFLGHVSFSEQLVRHVLFLTLKVCGASMLLNKLRMEKKGRLHSLREGAKPDSPNWLLAVKAPTTSSESWKTTDVSTQVVSRNDTFCTIQCFLAATTPRGWPQTSLAILTQADWCASRAVARCQVALLPVAGALKTGARVL